MTNESLIAASELIPRLRKTADVIDRKTTFSNRERDLLSFAVRSAAAALEAKEKQDQQLREVPGCTAWERRLPSSKDNDVKRCGTQSVVAVWSISGNWEPYCWRHAADFTPDRVKALRVATASDPEGAGEGGGES